MNLGDYSAQLRANPALLQQYGLAPPEPAPMQSAAPAPQVPDMGPYDATITPVVPLAGGSPVQQQRQLAADAVDTSNQEAASLAREGELGAQAKQVSAGAKGAYADEARAFLDASQGRRADNAERRQSYREQLDAANAGLDKPDQQWSTAHRMSAALGRAIMGYGMVLAGGNPADAVAAMDQHAQAYARQQQEKRARLMQSAERARQGLADVAQDDEAAQRSAQNDLAQGYHVLSTQLESLADQYQAPAMREGALRAALAARSKGLGILDAQAKQDEARRLAAASAAVAARERARKAGLEEREMRTKELLGGTQAEQNLALAEKARAEGGGDAQNIPGYRRVQSVEKSDASTAKKVAGAAQSLEHDLNRLAEIRRKNSGGTFNADDSAEARAIIEGLPAQYTQLYGSGAPSEAERNAFLETILDPTGHYARKDPEELYRRAVEHIRGKAAANLRAYGYEQEAPAPAGGGTQQFDFQAAR